MNDKSATIKGGTFHGDVYQVAADTIKDSFNSIPESAPVELKKHLTELNAAVLEMCKSLPQERQKQVAEDLRTLTNEATSSAPRKRWYELSADGLVDAAKAVGEIAKPVVAATSAVLKLLS